MEHSRTYNISNEHLLLISILNSMYNDNIQQINNLNQTITQLTDSNRQIMNLLVQMLYNPTNSSRRTNLFRPSNVSNTSRLNYRGNHTTRPTTVETTDVANANRVFINNTPYIIDNIQRYNIPRNNRSNRTETHERSRDENNRFSRLLESFFQPITVYPTQSQLETATRIVRYSDITTPMNRSCPISLENFAENDMVTVIRYCGHIFNSDEINRWFRTNCRCPVCRYDIRNYNPNTRDENYRNNENTSSLSENIESTASENNNSQRESYDDELLESGEERNTELIQRTANTSFNINDGNTSSLFLDIILDGFTEENIRDLFRETADISGNFLSSDNSSTTTFSSLINRAFNSSYR